jgi:Zn-dependent peptidase ImmA (M78 family)
METEKRIITEDNLMEWLSSIGYLFPRNKLELTRFEKLYSNYQYVLEETCVDPYSIIRGNYTTKKVKLDNDNRIARDFENLAKHVIEKLTNNQINVGLEQKINKKETISELAEYVSTNFIENNVVDLEKIASYESIIIIHDHFEDCFDSLLVYDSNEFSIHLNIDSGNYKDSRRIRFSIAHELGHYLIPEHHQAIINGSFPVHPSSFKPRQKVLTEEEADHFASHLLMPSTYFRKACQEKKFSLELIDELSDSFNVSKLSALLRFADTDAGTYPIMISFFRKGLLCGYKQSKDFSFKDVPLKTKIGEPPPPTSIIGEYYSKKDSEFEDVQEVFVDDWFWKESTQRINEQCFSDYDYDISVLWEE